MAENNNHLKNDNNGGTFHYSSTYSKGDTTKNYVKNLGTVGRVFRLAIIFALVAILVSRIVYGGGYSQTPFTDFITKFFTANWNTIKFSTVNTAQKVLDSIPFSLLRDILRFYFVPSAFIFDCFTCLINFVIAIFQIFFL